MRLPTGHEQPGSELSRKSRSEKIQERSELLLLLYTSRHTSWVMTWHHWGWQYDWVWSIDPQSIWVGSAHRSRTSSIHRHVCVWWWSMQIRKTRWEPWSEFTEVSHSNLLLKLCSGWLTFTYFYHVKQLNIQQMASKWTNSITTDEDQTHQYTGNNLSQLVVVSRSNMSIM